MTRSILVEATEPALASKAAQATMEALRRSGLDAGIHPTWDLVADMFRHQGGLRRSLAADPAFVASRVSELLHRVRSDTHGTARDVVVLTGGWMSARLAGEEAGLSAAAMAGWLAAWGHPHTAFVDGGPGPADRGNRSGLAHANERNPHGQGCVFTIVRTPAEAATDAVAHVRCYGDHDLVTSNAGKWREFSRLGLRSGRVALDLPEIDAAAQEVALHKSRAAGPMTLVEDTSLEVEGASVGVNVRWLLDSVAALEGRRATWRVLLATNDGKRVRVSQGVVQGRVTKPSGAGGFGFDPVFAPDGHDGATLADLEAAGKKDAASARALAVRALVTGAHPVLDVALSDLRDWDGPWQSGATHAP